MVEETEELLEARRWKHRRRMAYAALISIFVVMGICMFGLTEVKLKVLEGIVTMFIMSMSSIVGVYAGLSTWNERSKPKSK
jgi:hypothetical protein